MSRKDRVEGDRVSLAGLDECGRECTLWMVGGTSGGVDGDRVGQTAGVGDGVDTQLESRSGRAGREEGLA